MNDHYIAQLCCGYAPYARHHLGLCYVFADCTLLSLRDKFGGYNDTADRQLPIKGGPVRVKRSGK